MNSSQMKIVCTQVVNDIIDRMHHLCAEGRTKDAQALYDEIQDWVVNKNDIDVLSLQYLEDC